MKYYNEELSDQAYNFFLEEEVRLKASNKLGESMDKYVEQLRTYQHNFPKRFMKELDKHNFHDSRVDCVELKLREGKRRYDYDLNLYVTTYVEKRKCCITYQEVYDHKLIMGHPDFPHDDLLWAINELLQADNDTFTHEILFSPNGSLFVHFKKLKFRYLQE